MDYVPYDQRPGKIWHNGELVDAPKAMMHVYCHSAQYASGVIEGLRCYSSHIFMLGAHTKRLLYSAEKLDYDVPYTADQIDAACRAVIEANGLRQAYIRPFVYRGSEDILVAGSNTKIHMMVAAFHLPNPFGNGRETGIRLETGKLRRAPPECSPYDTKASVMLVISTLNSRAAKENGFDDALQLDCNGYVADCTISNIFMVFNGELHTPIADCFLPGITRDVVMGLAKIRGYKVVERKIWPEEMQGASEIFQTGTAIEVVPVCQIDERKFPVGEMTKALISDYEALVHKAPEEVNRILSLGAGPPEAGSCD